MTTATTTTRRLRAGHKRKGKRKPPNRWVWECPDQLCDQTRLTALDTTKGPSCPDHSRKMIKKGKVTR
jgi:hypothetical protein